MTAIPGQVARFSVWLLHHLAQIALGIVLASAILISAFAWRLSRGPLEITWIARVLEQAVAADGPDRLTIGGAALAWEGWRLGVDSPLDIRLTNLIAVDARGTRVAALPRVELSLSLGRLVLGRIIPRAVEIDGARLRASRAPDGSVSLDLGDLSDQIAAPEGPSGGSAGSAGGGLSELLRDVRQPPEGDHGRAQSRWAQLRRVRVRDASVTVADHQIGVDWSAPAIDIDLRRRPSGGVEGDADARIVVGTEHLSLTAQATPSPDGQTAAHAQLSPVNPSDLAAAAPGLAPLAALDATVTVSADAVLDADLRPLSGGVQLDAGAGQLHVGAGVLPLVGARLDATIDDSGHLLAHLARLEVAPRPDGPRTKITATIDAKPDGDHFGATVSVDLDQAAFADLPALWPTGVGGRGTKPWITKNITAGTAKNVHVRAALAIPSDFSDATLVSIAGGLDGTDMTVNWLRPVPPFDRANGRLTFVDPETISIAVLSGHQTGAADAGVMIRSGTVRITGIVDKDQFIDIDANLAGPVADLLAVLKNPRIRLLDKRPIDMRDPSGTFDGRLMIGRLPLRDNVSMDDLQISTTTHLTDVHLGGIAAGRDLDHGNLDLRANNDGLHVQGGAQIVGIPAQLAVDMDFRRGPPTQMLLGVHASATADADQIKRIGFDPSGIIAGPVDVNLDYQNLRSGGGSVALHADFSRTAVTVARAHVAKAAGTAATADLHATLDHDRLVSIDRVAVEGGGILVQGSADIAGGHPSVLRLQRVKIGATTDAHGEIRLPTGNGDPYIVSLEGPSLDVSAELKGSDKKPEKPPPEKKSDADDAGPPYRVDAAFDRLVVANGAVITGLSAHVESDGKITNRADIRGETGANAPFRLSVVPTGEARRLTASAANLGALLRELDVIADLQGGAATVTGTFDDARPGHPLVANVEMSDFRVRNAPLLGKLLQAMTLYGVADALSGPGLNFTHLIAPLRYSANVLELSDARAFSASLGMTARGEIDFGRRSVNIQGTVVPAYFFNTLLGDIPVVGKIFTAERGGGLFAANYSLHGALDDPSVGVNPLSILTPGFLRRIFGILDTDKAKP